MGTSKYVSPTDHIAKHDGMYMQVERDDEPNCYGFYFAVEGVGEFPFDMLRHDRCFPLGVDDAVKMAGGPTTKSRHIHLCAHSDKATWAPTDDSWRKFGWSVVRDRLVG